MSPVVAPKSRVRVAECGGTSGGTFTIAPQDGDAPPSSHHHLQVGPTDGVKASQPRQEWVAGRVGGLQVWLARAGCTVPSETAMLRAPFRCLPPREVLRDQVRVAQLQRHVLPPPRELGLVGVGVGIN